MTTMHHAGYVAMIELDDAAGVFHGEVINLRDVLTFQGATLKELRKAFADTVADYLAWCRERGKQPEKPYSGNFTVRLAPELHRRVAVAAAREGKSINAYVAEALNKADHIAERAKRADVPKALSILKRAGVGRRPVKGDELPRKKPG
jgi:predicted HicB family RNase H-like nuclease